MVESMLYIAAGFVFAEIWASSHRRYDGRDAVRYLVVFLFWPLLILVVIKSVIGGPLGK